MLAFNFIPLLIAFSGIGGHHALVVGLATLLALPAIDTKKIIRSMDGLDDGHVVLPTYGGSSWCHPLFLNDCKKAEDIIFVALLSYPELAGAWVGWVDGWWWCSLFFCSSTPNY